MKHWQTLVHYFRPHWTWGAVGLALVSFNVLLQLPMPLLTMYLIDHIVPNQDLSALNTIGIVLIVIVVAKVFISYSQSFVFVKFRNKVMRDIRSDVFFHVSRLPMPFFDRNNAGYLGSRVTSELSSLQQLMASTFVQLIMDVLTLVFGLCLIFWLNVQLAIISLLMLPFYILMLHRVNPRQRTLSREKKEAYSRVMGDLLETFSCIYVVKSFVAETRELSKMLKSLDKALDIDFRSTMLGNILNIGTALLNSLGKLALIWVGCAQIVAGDFTLGAFLAFNSFLKYIYGPTQNLMTINTSIQKGFASLDRIRQMTGRPVEVGPGAVRTKPIVVEQGAISIENLSFAYDGQTVLDHINLEIKPKTTVALVGRSGSGKTTLANLLMGMYAYRDGRICIDGIPIDEVSPTLLREQIALIPQDTFLFTGNVLFNLAYGKPGASREEIVAAAEAAHAHDFITSLPQGYETEIGERGTKLSGGQRQRIAIGMAILKNAPILILDEATSSLDMETEVLIKSSIDHLAQDRTTLVIAHRLSTVADADHIVLLDKGAIIDQGTHGELLMRNAHYQSLFQQFCN